MHRITFCLALALGVAACGGGAGKTSRPYQTPPVEEVLAELRARQEAASSFLAQSRMEYWADGERIKPTVLVMGQRGAKVRFNALSPAGDVVAADLACNGADFQYVDYNNNCQLTGPCNQDSIAKLLRVRLAPDDFLLLATGSAPILPNATGTLHWDADKRQEKLVLQDPQGWRQEILLDGRERRWDLLSSTVWNSDGEVDWRLTNKDFQAVESEDGKSMRLPERTRFEQPGVKSEVTIRWIERELNPELSEEKFVIDMPGVPRCGQNPP